MTKCKTCKAEVVQDAKRTKAYCSKRCRTRYWNNKRARSPEQNRKHFLKKKYRMTPEEWEILFDSQGRRCPTCKRTESSKWSVDHDHSCCSGTRQACGRCTRGIICNQCNLALGLIKDDVETLKAMIEYLDGQTRLAVLELSVLEQLLEGQNE